MQEKQQRTEAEALAEAKLTGKPVIISEQCVECNYPDCSLDILREVAMPDGSIRSERIHTY